MFRKYFFFLYWFLLVYIITAFVWWYIIIIKQHQTIEQLYLKQLIINEIQAEGIQNYIDKKNAQYTGEALVLLGLIIVGAFAIYQLLKKEFIIHKKEKDFLLSITHELKTPIATILLNLQTLKMRKCSEKIKQDLIQNSIDEIQRLNALYDNIMMSAQFENRNFFTQKKHIVLCMILKKIIDSYKNKNLSINLNDQNSQAILYGDEILLSICFKNLIDNAIKYCKSNCQIIINLYYSGNKHIIEFCDNGIGILDKEKKNIFHKFYRIGDEMTRETKGSGLGLFIVKKIIHIHQGRIQVLNNIPHGSIFKITFDANEK